jgi:homoserine kinase
MNGVAVDVPASTANLGPGFDCLALALELRNHLELTVQSHGLEIEIEGEGAGSLPHDASNRMVQAALATFDAAGSRPEGLRFRCVNRIPLGSGLGSSAAAIIAGVLAARALAEMNLSFERVLELANELEGHPDNIAASLYGGLTAVTSRPHGLLARRIPMAELTLAIAVPELPLSTHAMRQALPASVPLADTVFNLGHLALTLEALRTGDLDLLASATADRLHQPYRVPFVSGFAEVERAAKRAGASAVVLSGAGPGVAAFGGPAEEVAQAMVAAFKAAGVSARGWGLAVAQNGAQVEPLQMSTNRPPGD